MSAVKYGVNVRQPGRTLGVINHSELSRFVEQSRKSLLQGKILDGTLTAKINPQTKLDFRRNLESWHTNYLIIPSKKSRRGRNIHSFIT